MACVTKAAIQIQNDSCNIDTRVFPDFVYEYQNKLPKKTAPYHDVEDLTCLRVFIWKIS